MIIANEKEKGTSVTEIRDEKGKHITICSSSVESEYLSPRQLVQSALAGCMSMTVRSALRKSGVDYSDVVVTVDMEQTSEGTCFLYSIDVISNGDKEIIEQCKKKASDGCFIKELLSGDISFRQLDRVTSDDSGECCCG